MGSRDMVKYVMAFNEVLKPIAKWDRTPSITTPNKATSSFSFTVNISRYSTTYVKDYLYRKTTFVLQLFLFFKAQQHPAYLIQKCLLVDKCALNETIMCPETNNLFILKALTYIGPLNAIYVTYYTHGCFGIMDFPQMME